MTKPIKRIVCGAAGVALIAQAQILTPELLRRYVEGFNAADRELYAQTIPNSAAGAFLEQNVPRFECPDKALERTYYFRWWTYRKHLRETPDGWVVTEFLPNVPWSGKYNTISCPAGHHLYEGRWLRDPKYLRDYSRFWFKGGGEPRRYSFWVADAIWARHLVAPDEALLNELLPCLIANWQAWQRGHEDPCGLYWQSADRDGMECAIGGDGYRATINSYQYADALAIAELAGDPGTAQQFRAAAAQIKQRVETLLWDADAQFFKVLPRNAQARAPSGPLANVRELHGYVPWCFNLPGPDKSAAWAQLMDHQGFYAPYGPTTAEQRHPQFKHIYTGHECQWNGSSWPFATAQTLTALANLLNGYPPSAVGKRDYCEALRIYAQSHRRTLPDGPEAAWIDENLNPYTGDWTSRTMLSKWENGTWSAQKGGEERGKDYNHSSFADLVITGLVGLRPRPGDTLDVNPLVPEGQWSYFCLDGVRYRGIPLTILWDMTGEKYGKGKGLSVFADGKLLAHAERLQRVTATLKE